MQIIKDQLEELNNSLQASSDKIASYAKQVVDVGGPWIEGQD